MAHSGSSRNVLLCAGDIQSRLIEQFDLNVTPLFGDAGSATVISKDIMSNSSFIIHTDGKKFDTIIIPNSGFRRSTADFFNDEKIKQTDQYRSLNDMYMNGTAVFEFTTSKIPKLINEILEFSYKNKDEIDYLLLHQANKFILQNIVKRLKFMPERVPMDTMSNYGNTSMCSIPLSICDVLRERLCSEKFNVIMSGFGVGLSWGACELELGKIYCSPVIYK